MKNKQKLNLSDFKKLWKTKKSLEGIEDENIWQEILKEYWTRCHKPKGSITWKDLADRIFSEYIRLHEADSDGMCRCVTCGKLMKWTEIQNGHFISRGNMLYRFSEINCHSQCYACNCILSGNYQKYTIYMIDTYGREKTEYMINDKSIGKINQNEYEEMIIKRHNFINIKKKELKDIG